MKTVSLSPYLLQAAAACCLLVLVSCRSGETDRTRRGAANTSVSFEDTSAAEYAEGFRLTYRDGYKQLDILNPYQDRTDTVTYLLRPRNTDPELPVGGRIIDIPVRSMIVTSTTHVALTDILDANAIIRGVVGAQYLYNREIRQWVEEGRITPLPEGAFNMEEALAIGPDLLMVSAGQSSQFDDYRVLSDSGIGVLINAEWLETTPLGKAEWMKVMGALTNREEQANEQFDKVEKAYLGLLEKVEDATDKPLVISNMPFRGSWHVPAGDSFTARYLEDAGAEYPWFGHPGTGGLQLAFETVYEAGLEADIWVNPGAARSIDEILMQDRRFRDFRPVKRGTVYNNDRRMRDGGGNDFWESGVVRPDRILADLIHIMHPERLPDHQLHYYRKLE